MTLRPKQAVSSLHLVVCGWMLSGWGCLLEARAGGAGGGGHSSSGGRSSGGGGHFSGGGSSFHGSGRGLGGGSLSFPLVLLLLFVAILVVIVYLRFTAGADTVDSPPPGEDASLDAESLSEFQAANPDFDLPSFLEKVRQAFLKIQVAWSDQDISKARAFITDGIYQRYTTQFTMMSLLRQRNVLGNIRVGTITPISARQDGPYDVIDVRIDAAMHDSFICEADPNLNEAGDAGFTEYWSFLRKRGVRSGRFDLVSGVTCPSCGSPLPESMGEICRCAHCQVLVNSGEFDWVLAEITQAEDYSSYSAISQLIAPDLAEKVANLQAECPDFSVQLIEDKASNAVMQILGALSTRNPASMRRFVADPVFQELSATLTSHQIVYNRLYLNEVTLLDGRHLGIRHRLGVGIAFTMQRVDRKGDGSISLVDPATVRRERILILERNALTGSSKGALYQHQCPDCGGAVGDTIDVKCQYCGNPLNSTKHEWIVTGYLKSHQYSGLGQEA